MASTFQCEYCQWFTFKIYNKIHTKSTGHGRMYDGHQFGKNYHNVKTVNVVMQTFGRFVG